MSTVNMLVTDTHHLISACYGGLQKAQCQNFPMGNSILSSILRNEDVDTYSVNIN